SRGFPGRASLTSSEGPAATSSEDEVGFRSDEVGFKSSADCDACTGDDVLVAPVSALMTRPIGFSLEEDVESFVIVTSAVRLVVVEVAPALEFVAVLDGLCAAASAPVVRTEDELLLLTAGVREPLAP